MQKHERWIVISKEDLKAAKTLLKVELFSTVLFHCQQSAEKALKGYLGFKNVKIVKTHDLVLLLEVCMDFDGDFRKLEELIVGLNPFSTKFRYPTEYDIPEEKDAIDAIKKTEKVLKFVLDKISTPEIGQKNIFNK